MIYDVPFFNALCKQEGIYMLRHLLKPYAVGLIYTQQEPYEVAIAVS